MSLKIIIGQDVGIYATVHVPDNTDLSHDNLKVIANNALENEVFQPDYASVHGLRIVGVYNAENKALTQDVNLEKTDNAGNHWLQVVYGDLNPALRGPYHNRDEIVNHARNHRLNADPSANDGLYHVWLDEAGKLQVGKIHCSELEDDCHE